MVKYIKKHIQFFFTLISLTFTNLIIADTYKIALEEKRIQARKIEENRQNGENGLDNLIKVS